MSADDHPALLAGLFAQSPVPTAVVRGDELIFEMANVAYINVVGGRQVVGKPVLQALPELRGQGVDALLREVMASGQPHTGEEVPVRLERDGAIAEVFFSFVYAPLRGAEGKVERVIVLCNDVTEQVRARAAIAASEERFRRLVALLPMALYTCEAPSGRITFYNEQAAALWGRAPAPDDSDERFCGSLRLWRADGTPLPHDQTPMAMALTEGRPCRNQDVVIERPDGSRLTVQVNIDPLRDAAGRVVGAINVFQNVTAQRQSEQALREADRRKDEFLAMLSHELRNPLAPIGNAVTLLADHTVPAPVRDQACAILGRQVGHLVRLVDDLLDISRISRGAISLQKSVVELGTVLDDALETSMPLIEAAGHRLEVHGREAAVRLLADPVRLAQVVSNLLNNAAKYTPRGGRIELAVRAEPGAVTLAVRDDGVGISAPMLPRVFDVFTQDERTRGGFPGGLGIGLALARQMVELHGGTIEARSAGPGKGSEFRVRLPALASEQPLVVPLPAAATPAPGRRILLVEDNRDAAETLGMVLERMGHSVQLAYDGNAALEAARREPPELILADLDLPGLDGFSLAARLRADPCLAGVPIIAISGYGREDDRRRARDAGFDEHLVKPVEAQRLRAKLDGILLRGAARR